MTFHVQLPDWPEKIIIYIKGNVVILGCKDGMATLVCATTSNWNRTTASFDILHVVISNDQLYVLVKS